MTVQFPRNFAIPNLAEVEITNLIKCLFRCLFVVNPIEMPLDGVAIIQIFITEEIKLVTADFVRLPNDLVDLLGQSLTNQIQNTLYRVRGKEKSGGPDVRRANDVARKIESELG